MTVRPAVLLVTAALAAIRSLAAQDSQFGIRGLGTPGRWESVRARSTGGAFAPFDPLSPLIEAALPSVGRLTATGMEATSYRRAELPGSTAALRTTRFPLLGLAGPASRRLFLGGGYTTYLDRTYDVVTRDSLVLAGKSEPYTDEITSDGGVSDLRLAAAVLVGTRVALGVGVHVLTGSTSNSAKRTFDDSASYVAVTQADLVRYDGLGYSASAVVDLGAAQLAGFVRSDDHLRASVGDNVTARTDLPTSAGGALRWRASPSARLAAGLVRRSWANAGANAFNTVGWSVGAELGPEAAPFRFGARGGQLPFGPGPSAPTEWGVAAGIGRSFSGGRALLDLGLERLQHTGGDLTERIWTVMVGLTLRP